MAAERLLIYNLSDECLIFKQGPPLRARLQPVTLLCLGANAVLTLKPNSGSAKGNQSVIQTVGGIQDDNLPDQSVTVDDMEGIEKTPHASTAPVSIAEPSVIPKSSKDAIIITLVHGDALMVDGDDFEVSLTEIEDTITDL